MADQAAVDKVLAGEKNCADFDLSGADLSGMDLSRRSFYRADLRGADLTGADLRWSVLIQADLLGAKIEGTDFFACGIASARFDDIDGVDRCAAGLTGPYASPKNVKQLMEDLLMAIQSVVAGSEGHKSYLDPTVTFYDIAGCTIVQGAPGTSAYTIVFGSEDAKGAEAGFEKKPFSYPPLKRFGNWPLRFKLYDREIVLNEPSDEIQPIGSIRTQTDLGDDAS